MLLTEASPRPSWFPSPWSIIARDGFSHQKCGKRCELSSVLSASPQHVSFLPDAWAPAAQWELNSAWRLRVDSGLQAEAVCLLISSSTSVFTQLDSFTSHPNYLNICRAKLKLLYQSCIFRVPIFGLFPTHVFMISVKSSQPGDAPCGEGQQGRAEGRAVLFSRISAACILNLMLYNIETVSHFSFRLTETVCLSLECFTASYFLS